MNFNEISANIEVSKILYAKYLEAERNLHNGNGELMKKLSTSSAPSRDEYDFIMGLSRELLSPDDRRNIGIVKEKMLSTWFNYECSAKKVRRDYMVLLPRKTFWDMGDVLRGDVTGDKFTVVSRGNIIAEHYVYARLSSSFLKDVKSYFMDFEIDLDQYYYFQDKMRLKYDEAVKALFQHERFKKTLSMMGDMLGYSLEDDIYCYWSIEDSLADSCVGRVNAAMLPFGYNIAAELLPSLDLFCVVRYLGNKHFNFIDINKAKVFDQSIGEIYDFRLSKDVIIPKKKNIKGDEILMDGFVSSQYLSPE